MQPRRLQVWVQSSKVRIKIFISNNSGISEEGTSATCNNRICPWYSVEAWHLGLFHRLELYMLYVCVCAYQRKAVEKSNGSVGTNKLVKVAHLGSQKQFSGL